MIEVQCPICDYVTDLAQAPDAGLVPGLAESLGLTGLSTAQVDFIEKDMGEHLISHSVSDWVLAMRQADAYIERLEQGLRDQAAMLDEANRKVAMVQSQPVYAPPPVPADAGIGMPPPLMPPEWQGGYESPRDRQAARAAARKAGLAPPPPKDTLVPIMRVDQRPEGVVGRKF